MKNNEKPEYWMCIIGPTDRNQLPDGSDGPMRNGVHNSFSNLTGHGADVIASGWGINPERYELLRTLHVQDTKALYDALIYIRRKQKLQAQKATKDTKKKEKIVPKKVKTTRFLKP